jgi:poly-gamma-glutamate capsule biosynthesis protein CapA/YwtB (metallophosphatase superfamily)
VPTLELIAVGDVSLVCPEGQDPLAHVARYLRAGDIVLGNLEAALCAGGVAVEKEIVLRAPPESARYLRQAGFTILNVANNHTLDFGPAGLSRTLAALKEQGLRFTGVCDRWAQPGQEVIECKGLRVGFLGYHEADAAAPSAAFLKPMDRPAMLAELHRLTPRCDVAVVSLHWGIEYAHYPSPGQIELARDLVRNGAGLVLGHHPHVVQGIEELETGLVLYSLGHFQCEPRQAEACRSFLARVTLSARGVERYKLLALRIDGDNRPHFAWGAERRRMRQFVERISRPVHEDGITENWWFEQIGAEYLRGSLQAWAVRVRKYGWRHAASLVRWLVSRFTIKCCLGWFRSLSRPHE